MSPPALSPRIQALLAALTLATAVAIFGTSAIGLYVQLEARQETKKDIQEIHIIMNSRMDELLEETRKNARAEGVIEGEGR